MNKEQQQIEKEYKAFKARIATIRERLSILEEKLNREGR